MLAVIGLAGLGCGWLAYVRDRANIEDALIEMTHGRGTVWVERWGPRWLDLVGADRYRRRIVGLSIGNLSSFEPGDHEILERIARLRGLRHLFLDFEVWRPNLRLAHTLDSLPQLRSLDIMGGVPVREWHAAVGRMSHLEHLHVEHVANADICACLERLPNLKSLVLQCSSDVRTSHKLLTTVGKLKKLQSLWLGVLAIRGSSLACLSELTELQYLRFSPISKPGTGEGGLLRDLPPLPRLNALNLGWSDVDDRDIGPLADLPRLRSLSLEHTRVTEVGLAHLAPAASLEDLTIDGRMVSPSGLATLSAVKRLRSLHVGERSLGGCPCKSTLALDNQTAILVCTSELANFRQALEGLRRSQPEILIDDQVFRISEVHSPRLGAGIEELGPDALPDRHGTWWPASEWPVLSPSAKADFHKGGGRAGFDAATWGPKGPTTKF